MIPKVDSDVPLPVIQRRGREPKYPWRQLQVGQSFVVGPDVEAGIATGITRVERRLGIKLATRREGNGRRVWRIA